MEQQSRQQVFEALASVGEALGHGRRAALRLVDGFPEWAAAGLPVERVGA